MRITLLAALSLVAACDWEFPDYAGAGGDVGWWEDGNTDPFLRGDAEGWTQESTLWADTQGIALDETGWVGGAAMSNVTCQVDVNSGYVGADVDPDWGDDETVTHSTPAVDGGVIGLTLTDRGFQVVSWGDWDSGLVAAYDIPVLDVQFTDTGMAGISNDGGSCALEWFNPRGDVVVEQNAAGNCRPGFAMADDMGFVNTTAGLNKVTPGASVVIAEGADLVAWDSSIAVLYTAVSGESNVTAMTEDGQVLWTTNIDGVVLDLEAVPSRSAVALSVEYADWTGGLLFLDGVTGAEMTSAATVSAARDIELSGDGHTIGAAVQGQVHYLRVE